MLYRAFYVVFSNFWYNRNLNHLSELVGMALSVVSGSEFNRPVRPGTTQDGTGRCHAVRPWAGRKRCRLFEPGRGRTNESAGDGEVPSPAVIYRHPWILLSVLEQLYNSHYNTRYNHSDINTRFFSNLTLVFL